MLLFQDLAVVPLLILVPVLGQPAAGIGAAVAVALAKAALVLAAFKDYPLNGWTVTPLGNTTYYSQGQ